ncbi:membrane protein [Tatumella morbirosei]|uniref:Membrane protein n=1 Tax=Tatumella morbirosei TaxID=642227 RepID=A0A095VD13_9GAMM|nr:DUF943 family protein [Tatumella morbirosei]KGD72565.1 membrane protein [Tatumella morbirosei]
MKVKFKITLFALSFFACLLPACVLWLSLRTVEVVAVHENGNHSYILVKNFPFTDKGRINWWQENQDMLKNIHKAPQPDTYGFFTVVFWDFGDGYKEEGKYDRLCFEDMNPPRNCIKKNKVFTVSHGRNMGIYFTTNNKIYRMKKSRKIVKDESD